MRNKVGFEYLNQGERTVFETFLKYTDEKQKSAAVLGSILGRLLQADLMTILDVGAGSGEYLKLSLGRLVLRGQVECTLLEPSGDLFERLSQTVLEFPRDVKVKIACSIFDDFTADCRFDIMLASHLPFTREILPRVIGRMLELLRPDGHLIVVLRQNDDAHEFRTRFKSSLKGMSYQSLTIDDAIDALNGFAQNAPLSIETLSSEAELHFPIGENMQDVISIVEFFLNEKWEGIPSVIQDEILGYIVERRGILRLSDGFAVIKSR